MAGKHKLIRRFALIQVCLLTLVFLGYAWFSKSPYYGHAIAYEKPFVIGARDLEINTYPGEKDSDSMKVIYESTALEENFSFSGLAPGDRKYFKTVIKNDGSTAAEISVFLENLQYSPVLAGEKVKIEVTNPKPSEQYLPVSEENEAQLCHTKVIQLTDSIRIASGGTTYVYWSVYLDPEQLGNEAAQAKLMVGGVRIMFNS